MSKIYAGQTDLTIQLTVNKDITGAQSTIIKYKKPTGVCGQWTAEVVDATTGIIKFKASEGEIDISGTWFAWANIVDSNGLLSIGEPAQFVVYKELN